MAGQTVVSIKVATRPGTAKKDVEEAFEGAAQGPLKEELGSVGSAAAPVLAEIVAQASEEFQPYDRKRTLFIYDIFILEEYPEFKPGKGCIKDLMQSKGKWLEYIEVEGGIRPDKIMDIYRVYCESQGISVAEAPKYDRVAVFIHARTIIRQWTPEGKREEHRWPGLESYRPKNMPPDWKPPYPPTEAHDFYSDVKPIIKKGGELWVFTCGQTQEQWDRAEGYWDREKGGEAGYFTIEIIPGTGEDCYPRIYFPEYIRRAIED